MAARSALRKARMPTKSRKAPPKTGASKTSVKAAPKLGKLPEWNLADLYASIDAPEITRDLDHVDKECTAFETAYKGKLAVQVVKDGGGAWLTAAVQRYEAIDDVMGRLSSYAGLVHAGNTVD